MITKYKLRIAEIECVEIFGNLQNVVRRVHWAYEASDAAHETEKFGFVDLPDPNPDAFVPFDQLTANAVEEWVKAIIGEQRFGEYETSLSAWLMAQKKPNIVTLFLAQ
jgi:hypothetical protein